MSRAHPDDEADDAANEANEPGGDGDGPVVFRQLLAVRIFLIVCAVAVPFVMARLTGPILRDIHRLEDERARLFDLYGQAREDSLLDALTGLGNHRAFQEELSRQLEQASRHGTALALLLVDVDDLKKVNDEQGHAVGYQLLAAMGRITLGAVRRGDRAYRLGGDEFAVIQAAIEQPSDAADLARRIREAVMAPYDLDGHHVLADASIGISVAPSDATNPDQLLKNAD